MCGCPKCLKHREEQAHQSAVGGKSMLEESELLKSMTDRAWDSLFEGATLIDNDFLRAVERCVNNAKGSKLSAGKSVSDSETGPTSGFGFEVALNYLKAGRKVRRINQPTVSLDIPRGRLMVYKQGVDERHTLDIHSILAQDWELVMPLELNKLEPTKKAENFVSFEEALAALKKGKKVRRKKWEYYYHLCLEDKGVCTALLGTSPRSYNLTREDINSADWSILE